MRPGFKPTLLIFAVVLVLGVTLFHLTETVLAGSGPAREGIDWQGAAYLWPGSGVVPGEVHDCNDLDSSGDDHSSAKPADRKRGHNRKEPCGRDDYRRLEFFQPCGKAWSG
jgi:hypothetical protein